MGAKRRFSRASCTKALHARCSYPGSCRGGAHSTCARGRVKTRGRKDATLGEMPLQTPLGATADEVRALLAPLRSDFSIAVHSLGNAFALGGILRVAHNFLAREVIIVGNEPHYEKASMGMEKYESIVRVADDDAFFAHVRGRPVWAFERESATRSVTDVDAFPAGVVLVVGSERAGLSSAFLERADLV
ncbi:hypothetical protein EON82_26475, partial [bacterium]